MSWLQKLLGKDKGKKTGQVKTSAVNENNENANIDPALEPKVMKVLTYTKAATFLGNASTKQEIDEAFERAVDLLTEIRTTGGPDDPANKKLIEILQVTRGGLQRLNDEQAKAIAIKMASSLMQAVDIIKSIYRLGKS